MGLVTDAVESFTAKALAANADDIATILYTSGTMGKPKGVILTHANIVSNVLECAKLFPLTRDDAAYRCCRFPTFWSGRSTSFASGRARRLPTPRTWTRCR